MMSNNKNLREAEVSPDGRYVRFDEKLGNGAYKDVYLAYDTETGKEVAWNTVNLSRLPPAERKRIRMETEILAELNHDHIINFYHTWENKDRDQICFTTEIVTSGTLKQYTNRVKSIKLKVIKKWCRQILTALDYLHSHDPPIIHRDIKCDNIFINGGTGEIRIGDFGLSAARHTTHVESVLGTPEFMAPELYDEHYDESVDVYSFGCCLLEMVTKEYPYEECSNAAQIWKKVATGQKPEVLQRILDREVRCFIDLCMQPADMRLRARELLKHPFLKFKRSDPSRDDIIVQLAPRPQHNNQREGRDQQRADLKAGIEQRDREIAMAKVQAQTSGAGVGGSSTSSTSSRHGHPGLEGTDSLISPSMVSRANQVFQPSPSPTPTHQSQREREQREHHAPYVNTQVAQQQQQRDQREQRDHQQSGHAPTHRHEHAHGHGHRQSHAPSHERERSQEHAPHYNQQQQQPSSAHPPARFSRQAGLPHVPGGGGLTHSQSSQHVSHLQHPQPQRPPSLLTAPHSAHPNPSPELVHVSNVAVDVESTHTHFANIALHIHFEARRKKADGTYCLGRDVEVLLADGRTRRADQLTYHDRLLDDDGNVVRIALPGGVQASLPCGRPTPLAVCAPVPMFRVTATNASQAHCFDSFTCTSDHLLTVARVGKLHRRLDISAQELHRMNDGAEFRMLKHAKALQFQPASDRMAGALSAVLAAAGASALHQRCESSRAELLSLTAWLCGFWQATGTAGSVETAHWSLDAADRYQRWLRLLDCEASAAPEIPSDSLLQRVLVELGMFHCQRSFSTVESVRMGWIQAQPTIRRSLLAGLLDGSAEQQARTHAAASRRPFRSVDKATACMVSFLARMTGMAADRPQADGAAWMLHSVIDGPSGAVNALSLHRHDSAATSPPAAATAAASKSPLAPFHAAFTVCPESVSIEHVRLEVMGGNGRGRFLLADGTMTHNSSRKSKQIRFEFDFYRDTSDSIAGEMVRALKLPDPERTAKLIATAMEQSIDPLRTHYYSQAQCLTPDHEALVLHRGWTPIAEVQTGDRVWSLDGIDSDSSSWHAVSDVIRRPLQRDEPLYLIHGPQLNLLATAEHVHWCRNQKGAWDRRRSDGVWSTTAGAHAFPVAGVNLAPDFVWPLLSMPFLPADVHTSPPKRDAWCSLIGCFLACGTLDARSQTIRLHLQQQQVDSRRKHNGVRDALRTLGWDRDSSELHGALPSHPVFRSHDGVLVASCSALFDFLHSISSVSTSLHYDWRFHLSAAQARALLRSWLQRSGGVATSASLRDDLMLVAARAGWSCSVLDERRDGDRTQWQLQVPEAECDASDAPLDAEPSTAPLVGAPQRIEASVHQHKMVCCLTVASAKNFLVRRGSGASAHMLFTGNCSPNDSAKEYRTHGAHPAHPTAHHQRNASMQPPHHHHHPHHAHTHSQPQPHSAQPTLSHESPSPSTSPNTNVKSLQRPNSTQPMHSHEHERHLPPHPHQQHPHASTHGGTRGPSSSATPSPHAHPVGYSSLPSPLPQSGPKPLPHGGHHTMPHPTPKLSSAQPTNVTGPRPSTAGSKPPHPLTPHSAQSGQQTPRGAPSHTLQAPDSASAKGMGPRRHSHDPNVQGPLATSPDPLSASSARPSVQRTSSLGMAASQQHHHSHHHPPLSGGPSASPPSGAPSDSHSSSSSSSSSGMRRSSSTSSLGFMVAPEDAASKSLHDRLYDEYRLLSIAHLKERIKERMRERLKASGINGQGEVVELHGILEKNDLIESLIRLTPKTAVRPLQGHVERYGPIPSAASANHSPPRTGSPAIQQAQQQQQAPATMRYDRFDVDVSQLSCDASSTQSTPRMHNAHYYDHSGGATPGDRSRTHSIDAGENALLGSFAVSSRNGSHAVPHAQSSSSSHRNAAPTTISPNLSPSASPTPSAGIAERRPPDYDDHAHQGARRSPPEQAIHAHPGHAGGGGGGAGAGISPSPMVRSVSSPEATQRERVHELGRGGKKPSPHVHEPGGGGGPQPPSSRNFTFAPAVPNHAHGHAHAHVYASGTHSDATSPSSSNSNASTSGVGSQFDMDDLSHYHQHHHAGSGFPSSLHVDINPHSPHSQSQTISAPPSGDSLISPPPPRGGLYPTPTSGAAGGSYLHAATSSTGGSTPSAAAAAPSHAHLSLMTPQSPTIPEEPDEDESNRSSAPPVTAAKHNTGAPVRYPPGPSPSPVQQSKQMQHEPGGGVNPPLGARRKDYSASVDDLSRIVPPAGQVYASSSRPAVATGTPASSPASAGAHAAAAGGSGVVPSSGSHMRTAASLQDMASLASGGGGGGGSHRHAQSAENTPQASSRAVAPFAHQRANTSFVSGAASSPHDEVESEEKKKFRLETAERHRQQKKHDAAKAAKMCEDKIMSGFSLH